MLPVEQQPATFSVTDAVNQRTGRPKTSRVARTMIVLYNRAVRKFLILALTS